MKKSLDSIDLKPLQRPALPEMVAAAISEGLLNDQFQPGTRLVESDLATRLGVSRSPIREALTELANSGLVVRQPGRGAVIREWSVEDLKELCSLRSLLEGHAALLVHDKREEADFASLDAIVEQMAPAAEADDYGRMIDLDLAFHRRLWELTGHALLAQVLNGLSLQFRLFLTLNWKFHGGLDRVQDNHRDLMRVLRQGSQAEVEAAMDQHVQVENMLKGHAAAQAG